MILFIHASSCISLSLSISSSFDLCVCVCLKLGSGRLCHLFADCVPLALAAATSLPDMAMENDGNDEKCNHIIQHYSSTNSQHLLRSKNVEGRLTWALPCQWRWPSVGFPPLHADAEDIATPRGMWGTAIPFRGGREENLIPSWRPWQVISRWVQALNGARQKMW